MRKRELTKLIAGLGRLTPLQRRQVAAELDAGESRAGTVALVEKGVADDPHCPHCDSSEVVRNGTADGMQRFKCRGCARTFNALTGTPLARLRMKGKWVAQAEALRDGLTLEQAAERMNVSRTTAFLWRHRFLALPKTVMAQALAGIVETDETYFLESFKGKRRGMARASRKRGGKAKKPGTSKEQIPVLVSRDRTGATADRVLETCDAAHVTAALGPILSRDAVLCTDGSGVLAAAARGMGVTHHPVNLSAGVRVAGAWHVQNVNSYDSRLKGWLRRFNGVATKYLDVYLGWFRAIDRARGGQLNPALLLAQAAGNDLVLT